MFFLRINYRQILSLNVNSVWLIRKYGYKFLKWCQSHSTLNVENITAEKETAEIKEPKD